MFTSLICILIFIVGHATLLIFNARGYRPETLVTKKLLPLNCSMRDVGIGGEVFDVIAGF